MNIISCSVITGVRFSEYSNTIYLEIEVGKLLPMGFVESSSVFWQGPPLDVDTNVVAFDFNFRMFHLDLIKVETGFLSGFQMFGKANSLRLRTFSKSFENFTEGTISKNEVIQIDDDVENPIFFIQDRIPMLLKTPGKIDTSWNYNIFFGPSNQIGMKCCSNTIFKLKSLSFI